jgi:hypothetical protein
MPTSVKVDVKKGIVYSSFEGMVSDSDLIAHRDVLKNHPDFNPQFSEIVDFSKVAELRVTVGLINSLAKSSSIYSPASKHAVVAPHELSFGIARMYQMLAEDTRRNLAVVRNLTDARKFLGIEPAGETSDQ